MTTRELIEEALSLPVEERALVVDSLLRSLNTYEIPIDAQWADLARKRLQELRSGTVKPVPGDEVFAKVLARFAK
ncbi:MAG: addiction module protein [Pseudomonadota bacterium]